jgi:hypothetical protein
MNARTVRHTRVLLVTLALAITGVSQAFAQKVPRPEDALGFKPGADFKLATYEQAVTYFRQLEQATPLIKVFDLGKTSMGKPMIYAVITSQANMARLDRYKEITRKLSLVTGVGADEARALAAEGRAVVYIDGGLHANECAPAQHLIQLAYDLVTGDDATTTRATTTTATRTW